MLALRAHGHMNKQHVFSGRDKCVWRMFDACRARAARSWRAHLNRSPPLPFPFSPSPSPSALIKFATLTPTA